MDDGDDSDSSDSHALDLDDDPDVRAERALFEDPYQRKRRRKGGKEDALYGVFAEDSDDEGYSKKASVRRSDWAKAPAFVSSDNKVDLKQAMDVEGDVGEQDVEGSADGEDDGSEGEDDEIGAPEDYSDESDPSRAPSPRVRVEDADDEYTEMPRLGGIGSKPFGTTSEGGFGSRVGLGSSRGGIGSSAAAIPAPSMHGASSLQGIGSRSSISNVLEGSFSSPASVSTDNLPSVFGNQSKRFTREVTPAVKAVPLPAAELAHFSKIQGTFGARMLAKMGWQAGTGLGTTGEGIVTPIESKLRPQKMGIAFKGFKEKTQQSKMEAKRRGEVVSDDDEKTKTSSKKVRKQEQNRSDAWKRPKKVKTKVEHKTYEEIIAEAGQEAPTAGLGQIIDATGAVVSMLFASIPHSLLMFPSQPREVSSLADISLNSWSPSNDPTRIPEVRHNIRLIADTCKGELNGLAREAKALQVRKEFAASEDARLRKKIEYEAEREYNLSFPVKNCADILALVISRLQRVQLIAADVNSMSKELTATYEVSLEPFSPLFHSFIDQYEREFDRYQLDELVVAAITPLVRRMVTAWDPLKDPTGLISTFRGWRRALKVNHEEHVPQNQMSVYASETTPARPDVYESFSFNNSSSESFSSDTHMTYFESLLWNVWLPKVRTTINNEWSAEDPQPAVKLYELWSTFLPPFIRDNFLDQLVLPKVQKAVSDWNSKRSSVSLQNIVFPWLPHVSLRLEDVIGDARRKVKSLLRSWVVGAEMPLDLTAWKGVCGFLSSAFWTVLTINSFQVFDAGEWEAMMLKYVVPKLGRTLREDFHVNPRDQKMEPLQNVLQWSEILRPSIFSQLLETEFFPKWLDILHIWLIQPKVNFGEVAIWYSFWKDAFPEAIRNLSGVSRGFTRGLQLMNRAIELGSRAPTELARPDFLAEISGPSSPVGNGAKDGVKIPARPSARVHEITFRSIVEEFVASHNLLFVPTGRAHERSRMPLYRVSATADGKHGLLVYILDDAVWAPQEGSASSESDEFRAIGLEDIVQRATN